MSYTLNNINWTYTQIYANATSLSLNQTVYVNNGTQDCSFIPDGWYFTDQSANTTTEAYHIVFGSIIEVVTCITPTTTTTTTTLPCTLFKASKTIAGISTINYTTCNNVPAIAEVGLVGGGYSEITFCALCCTSVPSSVTLTNLGGC